MARKNERGTALLEGIAALGVVLVFTSSLLLGAYWIFARAFLQYESEQALLCLAEARPAFQCKRRLSSRLADALPWGRVTNARLEGGDESWRLGVEWEWWGCHIRIAKQLELRRITGASRSSASWR